MKVLLVVFLLCATAAMAQAPAAQNGAAPDVQANLRATAPKAPMDHVMIITKEQLNKIINPDPGTHPVGRLFDGGTFSVNLIHRKPGDTEGALVHKYTSEFYVVQEGGGLLQTGGKLEEPVNSKDPDMQSSKSIIGGETHEVKAGDVVFIPAGLPHHFASYSPSITYLNVRFQDSKYTGN